MNVAYHLNKLGTHPALISRIGTDNYGARLQSMLSRNGLSTDYLQVDEVHATGLVYAKPDERNEVTYDIVFPSAWDFIHWKDEFNHLLKESPCFIYGSLAARNDVSRHTLHQLLEGAGLKVLDINLRPPHFHQPEVEHLLKKADILKMNSSELELVAGWYSSVDKMEDRVNIIEERFQINTIIVTMGSDGALVRERGTMHRHPGYKVIVADTIGSGDAFLAGFIHKKLGGASAEEALEFASAMGAFIASQAGACPAYDPEQVIALIRANVPARE
jgi:fructokinase